MSVKIESFANEYFQRLDGMTFERLYIDTTTVNYKFENPTDSEWMGSNYTVVEEDTVIQITEDYISFHDMDSVIIIPLNEIKRWKICP